MSLPFPPFFRYAEHRPDEALLSVNSFQKDLGHPNPRVRSLALRVLSSIRVPVIVPVVCLAIKTACRDPSPAVRKAAAHALPKMFRLDRGREEELVSLVECLLRDTSPPVLSSAVAAFVEVCPHRLELLHRQYRKLCCLLVDADEWGQTLLATLLLRYARTQFSPPDGAAREGPSAEEAAEEGGCDGSEYASRYPFAMPPPSPAPPPPPSPRGGDEARGSATAAGGGDAVSPRALAPTVPPRRGPSQHASDTSLHALLSPSADFYEAGEEEGEGEGARSGAADAGAPAAAAAAAAPAPASDPPLRRGVDLDDDHRLLLRCSRPLLQSRNAGVVCAVATLHWYLAPSPDLPRVAKALVFAMRSSPESAPVMLHLIQAMACFAPALFAPFLPSFFSSPRDSLPSRALKLDVLTRCATPPAVDRLLSELAVCVRDADPSFSVLAVSAVGRIAHAYPSCAPGCITSLLQLAGHPCRDVSSSAVVALTSLVAARPAQHAPVVLRLCRRLPALGAPAARAAVVWLLARHAAAPQPEERDGDSGGATTGGAPQPSAASARVAAAAPHALRLVCSTFCEEEEGVKLALLGATSRLAMPHLLHTQQGAGGGDIGDAAQPNGTDPPPPAAAPASSSAAAVALYGYVLACADADASYDVRDKARLLRALLPPPAHLPPSSRAAAAAPAPPPRLPPRLAAALACAAVPCPPLPRPAPLPSGHTLASLSSLVGHSAPGYAPLPPHPAVPPPTSVRSPPVRAPIAAAGAGVAACEPQPLAMQQQAALLRRQRAATEGHAVGEAFYSSGGEGGGEEEEEEVDEDEELDTDGSTSSFTDSEEEAETSDDGCGASASSGIAPGGGSSVGGGGGAGFAGGSPPGRDARDWVELDDAAGGAGPGAVEEGDGRGSSEGEE